MKSMQPSEPRCFRIVHLLPLRLRYLHWSSYSNTRFSNPPPYPNKQTDSVNSCSAVANDSNKFLAIPICFTGKLDVCLRNSVHSYVVVAVFVIFYVLYFLVLSFYDLNDCFWAIRSRESCDTGADVTSSTGSLWFCSPSTVPAFLWSPRYTTVSKEMSRFNVHCCNQADILLPCLSLTLRFSCHGHLLHRHWVIVHISPNPS